MREKVLFLCALLLLGSLSGCLSSDSSVNEGAEQNDGLTDSTLQQNETEDRPRVNIHGLRWSVLLAECDNEVKPEIWNASGIVELFNAIDYDDSGELSYCEIFIYIDHRLMPYNSSYAMHIWTSSISDSFTFDEYFDYEQSRSPGMRYQEDLYRDAFNSADENQDQQIDTTEIELFIAETHNISATGLLADRDLFVESMIDSMRDGSLPLADIGDDGYLTFDEFAEFHNLGDEEYFYTVYSLYNELSWIFESTRGFTPQELFNITDSDVNGFITLEEFFYLGTEFENDLEFYWDYCEYNAESDDYMCWLSDWELDDSGETFSQCEEVYSGAWYCDGGASDDEDEDEDYDHHEENDHDDTMIGPNDWYHYPHGLCEWNEGNFVWQCKLSDSDQEWHNDWYYCELFGFDWHCTNYYGQSEEGPSNYDYYWWEYMHQFEDEYKENLMSSIYNCSKGNDDLVNNSEFENLYYIMQFDNPSDASFCLLDINYDGRLSIDEIVNTTNMFAIHNINFQPISVHNYDSLSDTFATFDMDTDLTLDQYEFTQSNYWKSMGFMTWGSMGHMTSYYTFQCGDGYLIPSSYLDDGEEDCPDGSDEIQGGIGADYGDVTRITLNQCTQEDITSCSGFACGFPSFESLDSNGNGTLSLHEFTNGLHAVDDYYSIDMYGDIFDYLIYFSDVDDDDETDDVQEINKTTYQLIGVNQYNQICSGFGCGFPSFEEVDTNENLIIDKDEFINKMSSINPYSIDMFAETFDEINGGDNLLDNYEYEQFLHDYDESYDNDIETEEIDYSEQGLLFSKSRSNCWHIKFYDGTNSDYSSWGGTVNFTDSDGVVTTIEDFSSAYTFLTLTGSESWIIEATFTEGDVGFEIDGIRYGGDDYDDYYDEDYYHTEMLYITFTE